jgi:hypothetical protein
VNLAAGGVMNRRARHNSLCGDKNKHQVTSYVVVHKTMEHVTTQRDENLCVCLPSSSFYTYPA